MPIGRIGSASWLFFVSTAVRRIALYLVHLPFFQVVAKYTPARWTSSFVQSMAVTSLQFAAVIGISALLYRYYESCCTHLRECVAPAVARLLRRTSQLEQINSGLPIAGKNCRAAIFAAVSFPWRRRGRPLYNTVLFRGAKTFHSSHSSRCLLVRNSSTDGTIKLAVQVCRDQLRRPAAGTQTES